VSLTLYPDFREAMGRDMKRKGTGRGGEGKQRPRGSRGEEAAGEQRRNKHS